MGDCLTMKNIVFVHRTGLHIAMKDSTISLMMASVGSSCKEFIAI
jgi:hypothetical protein